MWLALWCLHLNVRYTRYTCCCTRHAWSALLLLLLAQDELMTRGLLKITSAREQYWVRQLPSKSCCSHQKGCHFKVRSAGNNTAVWWWGRRGGGGVVWWVCVCVPQSQTVPHLSCASVYVCHKLISDLLCTPGSASCLLKQR